MKTFAGFILSFFVYICCACNCGRKNDLTNNQHLINI